jgi:hypothetical protein
MMTPIKIAIKNIVNIDIDTYKISYNNGLFDYVCESEKDVLVERFKFQTTIQN